MNAHPQKSMTANLQAFLPYAYNGCHGLIIAQVSDYFGEHSPIDSVSKIMKLCDFHVAKIIQIHALNLIVVRCLVVIQ